MHKLLGITNPGCWLGTGGIIRQVEVAGSLYRTVWSSDRIGQKLGSCVWRLFKAMCVRTCVCACVGACVFT